MALPPVPLACACLALILVFQVGGCRTALTPLRPIPTGQAVPQGTPPPVAGATELPPGTRLPAPVGPSTPTTGTPTPTASPEAGAEPLETARAALPLPGTGLAEEDWWTLVQAPGLPDMAVAGDLGPESHFAVASGNGGLNSLRAELGQPANAWIGGLAEDTLLAGAFLGLRRGDGHGIEIVDLAVAGDTVYLAVKVSAPGEWLGGETVFPLHLIGLRRSALPSGPLRFHFLDAEALGGAAPALFDLALDELDPDTDGLRRATVLVLQTADAATETPASEP